MNRIPRTYVIFVVVVTSAVVLVGCLAWQRIVRSHSTVVSDQRSQAALSPMTLGGAMSVPSASAIGVVAEQITSTITPASATPIAQPTSTRIQATPSPTATIEPTPIRVTMIAGGFSQGAPPFPAQELARIFDPVGNFGVILYDESLDKHLYELNADRAFYAASMIKIPIAITLYSEADHGRVSLDEQITPGPEDMVPGTGTIQGDPSGTAYTLHELARRMIVDSDNVAANLLLTRLSFERVNSLMQQLGATQTVVERLFFDEAAIAAGKDIHTSPRDLELLLRILLQQGTLRPQSSAAILAAMAATSDRTKIPALLPTAAQVQNKTGAIPGVEHDAAIVTLPNKRRYIVVFMSDALSGNANGVEAIATASRLIYEYESALP